MFTAILAFLAPIGNWFGQIFKNHKVSAILAVICIILFFVLNFEIHSKQNEIDKLKVANQNLLAANDSIRITAAKDKSVEYDKYSYIAKKAEDLEKLNADLYKQIKNTKGDVVAIVDTKGVIVDSGKLETVVVKDSSTKDSVDKEVEVSIDTKYSEGNYHKLSATIHINGVPDSLDVTGFLNRDEIGFTLITGIKKNKDGNYEIFARPGYPGAVITKLDGALIDKKLFESDKRHIFTLGFGVGYIPLLYNWQTKQTTIFGSYLGATIGVNINLTEILRKK